MLSGLCSLNLSGLSGLLGPVPAVQPEVVWVVRAVGSCPGLSRLSGPVRLSWLWQGGAEAGLVGRAGGGGAEVMESGGAQVIGLPNWCWGQQNHFESLALNIVILICAKP